MDLVPYMYYESQEPGSQLCAQHCLNNILQQFTYSEFDLAEIAQKLDQAENAELAPANQNKKSYNLDDTGYFSISVLERALEVWDLTLVRWRGEAMKPYQEHPEDQVAFILHLAQHWLPLRRFAPNPPHPSASKRWYNLNSFLPGGPEWISPTYLRLVLAQAEKEGYSVFVVRKAGGGAAGVDVPEGTAWGDGGIGILPECEADRMAVTLGEPVGRGGGMVSASSIGPGAAGTTSDIPTVDPTSSAGPSSPPSGPSRRRRRQEDLLSSQQSDDYSPSHPPRTTPRGTHAMLEEDEDLDEEMGASGVLADSYHGPTDFTSHNRSYDDEDAALQAALKASMEDLPSDWVAPTLEEKRIAPPKPKPAAATAAAPAPRQNWRPANESTGMPEVPKAPAPIFAAGGSSGGQSRFKEEMDDEEDEKPAEVLSPDEIRRRRLAKFGQ